MDDKRKVAYRKILYNFLIQIKNPDIPEDASAMAIGRHAAPVAYALHNFALTVANDFIDFDEAAFWKMLEGWNIRFPEFGFNHFRQLFELDLVNG
jgi:hypothetical protein